MAFSLIGEWGLVFLVIARGLLGDVVGELFFVFLWFLTLSRLSKDSVFLEEGVDDLDFLISVKNFIKCWSNFLGTNASG